MRHSKGTPYSMYAAIPWQRDNPKEPTGFLEGGMGKTAEKQCRKLTESRMVALPSRKQDGICHSAAVSVGWSWSPWLIKEEDIPSGTGFAGVTPGNSWPSLWSELRFHKAHWSQSQTKFLPIDPLAGVSCWWENARVGFIRGPRAEMAPAAGSPRSQWRGLGYSAGARALSHLSNGLSFLITFFCQDVISLPALSSAWQTADLTIAPCVLTQQGSSPALPGMQVHMGIQSSHRLDRLHWISKTIPCDFLLL